MNIRAGNTPLMRCAISTATILGLGITAAHAETTPIASCASLAKAALPDATVTLIESVDAGQFKVPQNRPAGGARPPPNLVMTESGRYAQSWTGTRASSDPMTLPAFCRVTATLHPKPDSNIRIEVWLPKTGWNGKFIGVGSGGLGGSINYAGFPIGMEDALRWGYAAAANDAGHNGSEDKEPGIFFLNHPDRLADYGWRADHEMTEMAKKLITAFYGKGPAHAYFIGCSMGSMEAINEAARFPTDYDGVIAGALMNPVGHFNAAQLYPAWLIAHDPAMNVTNDTVAMVHKAVLADCATPVGTHDGDVDDPATCHFDPGSLLCKNGATTGCLTAKQVEFFRNVYRGPVNPRTGALVFPGPAFGAENEIAGNAGEPHSSSLALFRYGVMQNANWNWKTLDYDKDIAKIDAVLNPTMQVGSNLNPFLDRGGKLFIFIGWQDYHNPEQEEQYYQAVIKNDPSKADSVRLFIVPGMNHCFGGQGCDTFDKIAAVDQWIASGKAPDQLMSTKLDPQTGKLLRSRPLCAYPKVAKYSGSGSMDDAANFSCQSE